MHKHGLPREIKKIIRKDTGISFMSSEKTMSEKKYLTCIYRGSNVFPHEDISNCISLKTT